MKKKTSKFPFVFVAIICWVGSVFIREQIDTNDSPPNRNRTLNPNRNDDLDTILVDQIKRSISPNQESENASAPYALPANALATSLSASTRIREADIKNLPRHSPKLKENKGFFFLDSNKQTFAASKLGLDFKHHFQNSFLVGYQPFAVSEIWMPHQVLTMRLKYQLDHENFPGFQEIWLTSYQAFQRGRGDCEDHSIALADWLIEMGEDARVVTGTHDGGGHAWVIVVRDTGTFLLEATSKRRQRLFSSYPLAMLAKGYAPTAMFNREFFWTNSKPEITNNYTGKHWFKNGRITYESRH